MEKDNPSIRVAGDMIAADKTSLTTSRTDERSSTYLTGWHLWTIIVSLLLGTLLIAIDNTIIGTVIPKISTIFVVLDDVGWYASAYLLTVTALQPTFGNLYKYFNIKLIYIVSILIFKAGSILYAAAPDSQAFIVGRAIAGVDNAGLLQGTLEIIGIIVPLEKRPLYFDIVVSVFGFATCFGPILGGVFTDHVTWRWCFWINVPIGVTACFIVTVFLRVGGTESEQIHRRLPIKTKIQHMDILGAVTLVGAVCCLLLALQWGGVSYLWQSAKIIGLFVGFGILAVIFGVLQWRLKEKATIPLRILRQRSILMGSIYVTLLNMSNYTFAYYIPFYFQAVQGVSATASGIRFIALALPEVVAIVLSGALTSASGHYGPLMLLSVIVEAVGVGLSTLINLTTTTVQWAAYLVVVGFGLGIGLQQPFTVVQAELMQVSNAPTYFFSHSYLRISEADVPIGNAITVFFTQLGGAIAISIDQTILLNGLAHNIPKFNTTISPQAVFQVGATRLPTLTQDPQVLRDLRESYSEAIVDVIYFALGIVCFALPFAVAIKWKNVKQISKQRGNKTEEQPKEESKEVSGL